MTPARGDRGEGVPGASDPLRPDARLTLFGHDATPARVALTPRSRRWRLSRSARVLAVGLVVAPVVAVVPPHAPWLIGALGMAGVLAVRRWRERYTVEVARGDCPRCGAEVGVAEGQRLRRPHPVACEACHHEAALVVDLRE